MSEVPLYTSVDVGVSATATLEGKRSFRSDPRGNWGDSREKSSRNRECWYCESSIKTRRQFLFRNILDFASPASSKRLNSIKSCLQQQLEMLTITWPSQPHLRLRVVHLGRSTSHAIRGRGDEWSRRGQLLSSHRQLLLSLLTFWFSLQHRGFSL